MILVLIERIANFILRKWTKGSVINNGAVIGAKALVKGEIPEYGIAVGVPAKTIKYRK